MAYRFNLTISIFVCGIYNPVDVPEFRRLIDKTCPLKVVIITDLGQGQKTALNAENTTVLPETLQVPSLCCFSKFRTQKCRAC